LVVYEGDLNLDFQKPPEACWKKMRRGFGGKVVSRL